MNDDVIMNILVGPEMDELIAVRVMGWTCPVIRIYNRPPCPPLDDYLHPSSEVERWRTNYHWREPGGACWDAPLRYSIDISAAWKVIEKMEKSGGYYSLFNHALPFSHYEFALTLPAPKRGFSAKADTVPMAICRVALMAFQA